MDVIKLNVLNKGGFVPSKSYFIHDRQHDTDN